MAAEGHRIAAISVRQWLREWEKVPFDERHRRRRPEPEFFMVAMEASLLRRLSGIYRRSTDDTPDRTADTGIQRRHEEDRSHEIREFVRYGYPWSDLAASKRRSHAFDDLRKPGWLPTAVVVNVLLPTDRRTGGESVKRSEAITVERGEDASPQVIIPKGALDPGWRPSGPPPIEVIDGQHRLWAFEPGGFAGNYELPVVMFFGLDLSWQAYLFWTINITPKKINRSLAFDLYPLLRTEDWLERFEGHSIYRETRAQELTQSLWSTPESPWHHRINMLGEPGRSGVSQAAWIRALMASYVKAWEGQGTRVGGLFGAPVGKDKLALPWTRNQQAAFLILVWESIRRALAVAKPAWATSLGRPDSARGSLPGLYSQHTLLATDQGVRAVLQVTNDLCWVAAAELQLFQWSGAANESGDVDVAEHIESLEGTEVAEFLTRVAQQLVQFDWRTSAAPGLTDSERTAKAAFRGSGGYKELRLQVLRHLARAPAQVGARATRIMQALRYV